MAQSSSKSSLHERRTRMMPMTNASADFILTSVALAENSQYVPEIDRFVTLSEAQQYENTILSFWNEASSEKEKLFASLELLRQKSWIKETTKTEAELHRFTWSQVIFEVQSTSDMYKNTVFAKMCDKADIFKHWLGLLPTGDYGSVISGAFLMGIQAARGVGTLQKSIYETLADIPDTISHANAYVEIYKAHSSEALVEKTALLCKYILITLQLIIQFFLKGSFRRGASAILKGDVFQRELKESIQDIKNQTLKLREDANICLQKRIAEMDRKSDLRASTEQFRHQLAKEDLLLAIDTSTEITAQKVCTYLLRHLQANPDFNIRSGGLKLPTQASSETNEEGAMFTATYPVVVDSITPEKLLCMLNYDDHLHQKDVQDSLTLGFTQTDAFQASATWIFRSPELETFLTGAAKSKFLLINGNYDGTQFISPVSYVCAKISDLVTISNHVLLVSYFCSRHTDEFREPRANARGLLSALIGQLLSQIKGQRRFSSKLDLSAFTDEVCCAIQADDLDVLLKLFFTLVMQLPKGTIIFCLIDGISVYESTDRREDTITLMKRLARMVKKSTHVVYKLLVTCPGRSNYVDLWGVNFDGKMGQVVEVPEIV